MKEILVLKNLKMTVVTHIVNERTFLGEIS